MLGVGDLGVLVPALTFFAPAGAVRRPMYAVTDSVEGDCYLCVPPDPSIEAAALGASESAALDTCDSAAPGASDTMLTPLSWPVSMADPSGGPVLAHSSTVLPCPAALSGLLSGLHLPSFSMNLVSGADLQDAWVDQFTPRGQRETHCTCSRTGRHLATFTRRPGSSLYTLTTASPPVTASGQVPVSRSSPASAPCSCRPLSHKTLLWHHRLGHPSLPRLRGMASRTLGHERYFMLVVDDYSRYTTVFPLRRKGEVTEQNGIAERRIDMVMDVARMSMIHAAAPHFLWPFAVQYAAHQINLQPCVSLPETTPTLRWTGKVGDASVFRVWGSRAFGRDASADKLSSCADVTFDESVSYYCLFPYRTAPLPPPATLPSTSAWMGGAGPGVAESEGAEPGGAEPGGVEPEHVEPGGAESGGAGLGGTELERAESGGPPSVPSRREPLSPQQLREWYARHCSRAAGATGPTAGGASGGGAAGATGPGGAGAGGTGAVGGPASVGATGGAGAAGPGGARTGGTGAAGAGGALGVVGVGAVGAGVVATGGAAGAGAAGGNGAGCAAGVVAGYPGAEVTCAVSAVSGGAARPRPYYVPLLQQPASPLPGPSPYSRPTRGLTERREPESRPASPESCPTSPESRPESPVHAVRTGRRVLRQRPSLVLGTHSMTLRPSTAPQRVPLLSPPASSLPDGPDPESDSLRAATPTVMCFLATTVTDPSFESTAALVAESESVSVCPPSVGGECALGTDVHEDRQEDLECFAAALPHLVSMLLAPQGDPDAPDIPTPRSYAEAIEGPYSSQWQAAMDAEMASWKSTGTYVDEVPTPGANIISGMWIFRGKRPPGSLPVFKARYVARGFSQ
ncbi:unnamed protein product [Closterium sp. NIES-54]